MGKTEDAVNTTVEAAIKAGKLDRNLHAAPIEIMRSLARTADQPDFPCVGKSYDNVTIPTLLKYLQSLGLAEPLTAGNAVEEHKANPLDAARKRSAARLAVV